MPKYIDTERLKRHMAQKPEEWRTPDERWLPEREIALYIDTCPEADVVEIVRCKDCKYSVETDKYERWCYGFCQPARLVRSDDYCSHGKKEKPDER